MLEIGAAILVGLVLFLGLTMLASIAIVFISGTDSTGDDLDYDFED